MKNDLEEETQKKIQYYVHLETQMWHNFAYLSQTVCTALRYITLLQLGRSAKNFEEMMKISISINKVARIFPLSVKRFKEKMMDGLTLKDLQSGEGRSRESVIT